jgi:hypothetical protein
VRANAGKTPPCPQCVRKRGQMASACPPKANARCAPGIFEPARVVLAAAPYPSRPARAADVYRIDLVTGAVVLDTENPGDVSRWLVDSDFRIRGAVATVQADGSKARRAAP